MPPSTVPRQRRLPKYPDERQPRLTLHPGRGAVIKAAAAIKGLKVIEYAEMAMDESIHSVVARQRPLNRDWSASPRSKRLMAIGLTPSFAQLVRQAAEIEGLTLSQMADKHLYPKALKDLKAAIGELADL